MRPGQVVDFSQSRGPFFSVRDRIETLRWQQALRQRGVTRMERHAADDHGMAGIGDFLLLYCADSPWSRWSLGCDGAAFLLWDSRNHATAGSYPSLAQAFEAVAALLTPAPVPVHQLVTRRA